MRGTVKMLVPIEERGRLIFTRWLPSEASPLRAGGANGDLAVSIWTGHDCLDHIGTIEHEDVPNHINLMVDRFHVEVSLGEIDDKLAAHIHQGRDRNNEDADPALEEEYEALGLRVYETTLGHVNRLLEYARVEHGQYWLAGVDRDVNNRHSFFNATRATVMFDTLGAARWNPPPYVFFVEATLGDENRYLAEEDWDAAGEYMRRRHRPDLVKELLVKAEQLLDDDYLRAAVVECVVALEIAIGRFVESPTVSHLAERAQGNRVDLGGLPRLREKLGLRGCISYLLPLVLDEEQMPQETLDAIRNAVDLRGNVVHNGQRNVACDEARRAVRAVREFCTALTALTDG